MTNRIQPPVPGGPPDINPDDVAVYLEVQLTKTGTERQVQTAMEVERAMGTDPKVRAFVEQLLRLQEPIMHPENHPSGN
ncbi:MAG: hypothetical protein PHS73_03790 [Candidatus Peribacteraceae bacterium]|nr:hypothetical protein [Candidatus Peribacteraceae bacterium]